LSSRSGIVRRGTGLTGAKARLLNFRLRAKVDAGSNCRAGLLHGHSARVESLAAGCAVFEQGCYGARYGGRARVNPRERGHGMELDLRYRIAHAPSGVFQLLADPRQRPRWQRSLSAVEMLDSGEPRLGMRWRERPYGLARIALAISAFERDRLWGEQFDSPLARGSMIVRFTARGADATDLDLHATIELRAGLPLLAPAIAGLLRREILHDLASVERVLRG
jgi:hypothetical protein